MHGLLDLDITTTGGKDMNNWIHSALTFLIVATVTFTAGLWLFPDMLKSRWVLELPQTTIWSLQNLKPVDFDPLKGLFTTLLVLFANYMVRSREFEEGT